MSAEGNYTATSIDGGNAVWVGDNVTIVCHCLDTSSCISTTMNFRINGQTYTERQLTDPNRVTPRDQYTMAYSYDPIAYKLELLQATFSNNGTTYQCQLLGKNWEDTNMVTLIVEGETMHYVYMWSIL